tara:strand:+ start:610 stop:798 length:189 start_codon:yes stop_codon:yes gene_type:complete
VKLILWGAAIVATIGARGLAVLLVVPPLVVGALWYLTRRTDKQAGRTIQAATEKLRGLGGQG